MKNSESPALPFFDQTWSVRVACERLLGSLPAAPTLLPRRKIDSHKGDFGRVLLVGGSRGMAGSIGISATSCLKAGAGLVTVGVPDCCLETVAGFNPCLMTLALADDDAGQFAEEASEQLQAIANKYDVLVLGPGMGTGKGAQRLVESCLTKVPLVVDADALNVLSGWEDWEQRIAKLNENAPAETSVILTPHPGEWKRLCGVTAEDRGTQQLAASEASLRTGAVILLKGSGTYIAGVGKEAINSTGNPGMATAGSGDCLSGILGAMLGRGLSGWESAVLGAWVHGVAGDLAAAWLGQAGVTAWDIQGFVPWAIELATEA